LTSLHKELVNILEKEKALLGNLYSIVSEERDAIVGLKSVELERILRDKEQALVKLSLWEEEREKLLKKNGLNGSCLSEILKNADNEESDEMSRLQELYKNMKTLLCAIAEIQKINEQLIDRSIVHIGTAVKFLESFGITARQNFSKEV